jgi:DNA-binding CsgD family transcriptional regulator
MRVLLVGQSSDRARLRPMLVAAGIEIVGEAVTASAVEHDRINVDAIVVAPVRRAAEWNPVEPVELEPLTPRERDVLTLIAEGLANKAIAVSLGISDQTVKFHVAAIIAKLGAGNRTDAVRRAVRRGVIAI